MAVSILMESYIRVLLEINSGAIKLTADLSAIRGRKGITMYSINLNERELSFLFNLLESDIEKRAQAHAWYRYMHRLHGDDTVLTLNEEQRDVFYQDMVCNSEEILRQIGMKVRYHSMDDSSWSNNKWCLETISDILNKIQDAKEE